MKLHLASILLLMFASAGLSAESRNARNAGHSDYSAGEFKKAASHFQRALKADPNDADSCFWLGKSYEMLADIRGPVLGTRAAFKARLYLARALELAPENEEYRREFFQLSIAADHSAGALRRAQSIIQMTPESDPDYPFMLIRLHQEHEIRSSLEERLRFAVSIMPASIARIAQ